MFIRFLGDKMSEMIRATRLLVLKASCFIILLVAFLSIVIIFRRTIDGWKLLVAIFTIALVAFLIVYSFYLCPFISDCNNCEVRYYETVTVCKSYSNNILLLNEIEVLLPNGEHLWVKTAKASIENGTILSQVVISNKSQFLIDYKIYYQK